MSVRPLEPVVIHRAYCTECESILKDTDADRLGVEMERHEREGCA